MDRREFSKLAGTILGGAALLPMLPEQAYAVRDLDGVGITEWEFLWGDTWGVGDQSHIDRYLTDLSVEFLSNQNDFISDKVFLVV